MSCAGWIRWAASRTESLDHDQGPGCANLTMPCVVAQKRQELVAEPMAGPDRRPAPRNCGPDLHYRHRPQHLRQGGRGSSSKVIRLPAQSLPLTVRSCLVQRCLFDKRLANSRNDVLTHGWREIDFGPRCDRVLVRVVVDGAAKAEFAVQCLDPRSCTSRTANSQSDPCRRCSRFQVSSFSFSSPRRRLGVSTP